MNLGIETRYEELSLAIYVKTLRPTKIRLQVYDSERPKSVFTNRYKTIKGGEVFYVRMPLSPNKAIISVYNDEKGNLRKGQDNSFVITEVKKMPLEKRTDVGDIRNVKVANFVDFIQRFCFNSSYLNIDQTYQSKAGEYLIEYLSVIKSSKNGKELKTPARISKTNGRIQVAKEQFDEYTIPMRIAILLHEFSHFYLNEDMDDETEADLNGLLIYLGLGFPRIEGYQAFLEVFQDTPTIENKKRYDVINKFIRDFESNKVVMN
jgi:hypothetical protein